MIIVAMDWLSDSFEKKRKREKERERERKREKASAVENRSSLGFSFSSGQIPASKSGQIPAHRYK